MTEYIDKSDIVTRLERVIKYGKQAADGTHTISAEVVLEVVNSLPATDVVVRKTGKWEWLSSTYDRIPCEMRYRCSECHHETILHSNEMAHPWESFCPNCGADMRENNG